MGARCCHWSDVRNGRLNCITSGWDYFDQIWYIKRVSNLYQGNKKLPISMRTGFYDSREQIGYGKKTTSAISIETFTWHLGLVLTATGGAYLLDYFLKSLGLPFSVPLVCLALFCGIAINAVLKISKLLPYTDKEIVTHIGSSITDYLLFLVLLP